MTHRALLAVLAVGFLACSSSPPPNEQTASTTSHLTGDDDDDDNGPAPPPSNGDDDDESQTQTQSDSSGGCPDGYEPVGGACAPTTETSQKEIDRRAACQGSWWPSCW